MQHDKKQGILLHFYKKYNNRKLELVMSVYIDNLFMSEKPKILENITIMINLKFNIQESWKEKKFFRVYHEWGRNTKGPYAIMTMKKNVNKLVDGYKKFIGSDIKVQKTSGAPGTTLGKSELV